MLDASERDKAGLYGAADVFLSLSDNIQETFGLTVVEALAAGLPVVASDWDGYKALVRDGISGYLVPTRTLPDDSEWSLTRAWVLNAQLRRKWLDPQVADSPKVHRRTVDDGYLAVAYRFR